MKNTLFWVLVAIVVVAAVFYFGGWKSLGEFLSEIATPLPSPTSSPATGYPGTGGSTTSTKSYTELVIEYGSRRIQFDERCQMSPKDITFKNGTTIMLDNRSGQARNITIGGTVYSLSAYGYRLVTLSSSSLPKSLSINCGSSGNVGRILLQANILQQ